MKIQFAMQSDVGLRPNNEDAMLSINLGNNCHFFAVADGMGGAVAGEIASNLVLKKIKEYLQEIPSGEFKDRKLKYLLSKAVLIAQNAVFEKIEDHPALKGMGTTLSAILICKNKYAWANIGDSRIYHFNQNHLNLITSDHTYLNDFIKEHNTEVELSDRFVEQYGHLITRAINGGSDVADIFPSNQDFKLLREGDVFLLCSDGLITRDMLNNHHVIKSIIKGTESSDSIISKLIERASKHGSKDNITAILVKVGKDDPEHKTMKLPAFKPKRKMLFSKIIWIIIIFLAIAIGLYSFTQFFRK